MSESARVRAARAAALERQRRHGTVLRPLGIVLMALVIVPSLSAAPGPGLAGESLAVTVSLAVFAGATALIFLPREWSEPQLVAILLVVTAAGTAITALQADGAGELTVGLVTWTAAARLALRPAVAL